MNGSTGARVVVVGLGNWLMGDDGVGVHAVRALAADPPRGVTVIEAGTSVLDALPLVESAEKVLAIDAVEAGGAPGTVYAFDAREAPVAPRPASMHSLDLPTALACFGRGPGPAEFRVLGVEPSRVGYGTGLSCEVRDALPALTREIRRTVAEWTAQPGCDASPEAT
jgi:hydrogenase maturation protease